MKKKLLFIVLLVVAAPTLWLGFSVGPSWANQAQRQRPTGSWVVTVDIGQPVDVLLTLAADGNVIGSGQLRAAGEDNRGAWMGTRYNTTAHGSWTRVGPNQIKVLALLQVQDNDGVQVFYEKVVMQMTLDEAGTSMAGTGLFQLFAAGVDPLDPDAPVFAEGSFTQQGRLIR